MGLTSSFLRRMSPCGPSDTGSGEHKRHYSNGRDTERALRLNVQPIERRGEMNGQRPVWKMKKGEPMWQARRNVSGRNKGERLSWRLLFFFFLSLDFAFQLDGARCCAFLEIKGLFPCLGECPLAHNQGSPAYSPCAMIWSWPEITPVEAEPSLRRPLHLKRHRDIKYCLHVLLKVCEEECVRSTMWGVWCLDDRGESLSACPEYGWDNKQNHCGDIESKCMGKKSL